MRKAVRTYLELALGVTDTSTKKVRKAVEEMVGKGGATADQIKALTSDLMAARSANREGVSKLVRFEVDRALGVVGLATADEVNELTARVRDLERKLRQAETSGDSASLDPVVAATRRTANRKAAAKRATAAATLPDDGPSPIARAPRGTGAAATPAATGGAARQTAARKTAVKKATTKATTSKAAPSKASVAKKTAPRKTATKAATKAQP